MVEALTVSLGVQDAESRRKARLLKRKDAEDDRVADLDDANSDSTPSSKRQRL